MLSMPISSRYSTAAPSPMRAAMGGVPASNLLGVVGVNNADQAAFLPPHRLPMPAVGVKIELGHDDLIASADERPAVAVHPKVDGVGRATRIDPLALFWSVDKVLHLASRTFVG